MLFCSQCETFETYRCVEATTKSANKRVGCDRHKQKTMIPKENIRLVYKNRATVAELGKPRTLRIIHFNDVYNVEGTKEEPIGGAARFAQALDSLAEINPDHLILFSGDAFSPSTRNTIPSILNYLCSMRFTNCVVYVY